MIISLSISDMFSKVASVPKIKLKKTFNLILFNLVLFNLLMYSAGCLLACAFGYAFGCSPACAFACSTS